MLFRRSSHRLEEKNNDNTNGTGDTQDGRPASPNVDIKRATRTRRNACLVASFCFFVSVIFLILVEIGSTYDMPVIRDIYFFKMDLSNIIPLSVPNAVLINSIAQSLGLHDFYQVGLWGFCEGYDKVSSLTCSPPENLYWFNPVSIILNELLAGATIALPNDINHILDLIRDVSHIMFGFFITGAVLNFVSIFVAWIVIYSRWWSLLMVIFTFIAALLTVVGSIIATVMFIIFRNTITSQDTLNIKASLGTEMFVFMWIASAFSLIGFIIHLGLSCCCASRRDVRTGRRKGNKHAYTDDAEATGANGSSVPEKRQSRLATPNFSRNRGSN